MINKMMKYISAFSSMRKCSNSVVAFKTEIISVLIRNQYKRQRFIQRVKLNYLKDKYKDIIKDYANKQGVVKKASKPIVWIMWWQGEEGMPPIVKACYNSVKKHVSDNVDIVLLTESNFSDYVDIPENILFKVQRGIISLTHLSDIIRMSCIAKYGGIWLDSTIFVNQDIPDSLINRDFFSLSTEEDFHYVSKCKWSSFAIGGNSIVFDFMRMLFLTYWEKNETMIDFFFIDYGLRVFYDSSCQFREFVETDALYVKDLYELHHCFNEVYDDNKMTNIAKNALFCKLSWKGKKEKLKDGKLTFYGHLIAGYE